MPDVKAVVVIRSHPDRIDLVLLDTPPELASTMGRFQPARYAGLDHGAYVMPTDALPAFATFTRANRLATIDDRSRPTIAGPKGPGTPNPLPECSTCGQPAKRSAGLRYCPTCGDDWHPVTYREQQRDLASVTCPTCSTRQRIGFALCHQCGSPLPNEETERDHGPIIATRQPLADPQPLAATIDETLAGLARPGPPNP